MLPTLTTERLVIAHVRPGHGAALADFFRRNETHLARWDPPRPAGVFDAAWWERDCERSVIEYLAGSAVRWAVCAAAQPERIVGRINYTQVFRGPFQSCMLGYAIDAGCEGRGMMREALEATIRHAFDVLQVHRIQANYVPDNARSARLLQRLGFAREGLARQYLYVGGAWRDHVLTARLNPAFDDARLGVTRSAPA